MKLADHARVARLIEQRMQLQRLAEMAAECRFSLQFDGVHQHEHVVQAASGAVAHHFHQCIGEVETDLRDLGVDID